MSPPVVRPPGAVPPSTTTTSSSSAPTQRFKTLAPPKQVATKPAAKTNTLATATTTAKPASPVATTFRVVQHSHHVEAERRDTVRTQHHVTAQQQLDARNTMVDGNEQRITNRVLDLIVRELTQEFEARPARVANPVQLVANEMPFHSSPTPLPMQVSDPRATQAAALIERIDTFVKSQRPALALTLNNSLGARVEIEKLGPGRIALKLIGQRGPPSAETVTRIRDELQARGLTVGALSVA